jgi:hypothetical protein
MGPDRFLDSLVCVCCLRTARHRLLVRHTQCETLCHIWRVRMPIMPLDWIWVRNINCIWSDLKFQVLFNCLNTLPHPITLTRGTTNLAKDFSGFPQPFQENFRLLARNKPRPLPFTLFPFCHSLVIMSDRKLSYFLTLRRVTLQCCYINHG